MKNTRNKSLKLQKHRNWVIFWIVLSLASKFIVISNINSGIWLGADGESYINGARAILRDGFFSKDGVLQYWPAGYPVVVSIFAKIFGVYALPALSVVQSIVFAYGTWHFARTLEMTKFSPLIIWITFFISFAPTLSLSSLSVGYESFAASLLLLSSSLLVRFLIDEKRVLKTFVLFGSFSSLVIFMQPRYIVVSIVWILLCFALIKNRKLLIVPSSLALVVLLIFPGVLIARNHQSSGSFTISNNLGVTMNLGAGFNASGGYTDSSSGVECVSANPSDSDLVKCVLNWYLNNPRETMRLAWNKSIYFWSPWYGPNANGTMARNPWLKMNPAVSVAATEDGKVIVFGVVGKVASSAWTLANILLMIAGVFFLWLSKGINRKFLLIVAAPIMLSWIIAIGTIGDHRFRVPVMSFVIILQIVGWSEFLRWRRMRDLNPR